MPSRWTMLLRLFSVSFKDTPPEWWNDTRWLASVFSALEQVGLWDEFELYGLRGGSGRRLKSLGSKEELLAQTASWRSNPYLLRTREEDGLMLGFTLRPGELALFLEAGEKIVAPARDSVLEKFITFARLVHDSFVGVALMGPDFQITLPYLPYPRPRPPRLNPYGAMGALVDFYSKPYFDSNPISQAHWNTLAHAELPPGAVREQTGELLTIRWAQSLEDESALSEQMSAAETWIADKLDAPIQGNFNDLGDALVFELGVQPKPPLSLYNAQLKYGYKALVQNPDGGFDEQLLGEVASWISAKSLPDGTPLEEVRLILPNRESALSIYDRAKALGVSMVLYMDNRNALWNPFPSGLWIEK